MLQKFNEKFGRGRDVFSAMSPTRKVTALGVLAAVIAGFIVLMLWANTPDYATLYTGLDQEDAGAIVKKLQERKTPYELRDGGTSIGVPRDSIQETRLYLATEGLPTGGAVGMELFDQNKLGETDFVQRLNYQRALQGELERTIKKFREVEQVRIHLNIPKESLFIEEAREPSASVMLKLRPGAELSQAQLAGIVHLVASSVEGMKPESISVVDATGGLIYSKEESDNGLLSATQLQQRRSMEQRLTQQITTMLERVVGPDKAMARVSAELNHQQMATTEEIYDPDRTAIRSEQRLSEKNQGAAQGAQGTPNATYQIGTGNRPQNTGNATGEFHEKSEDTTNYEITRINRQITTPGGDIKRLSVAVMVDGTYKTVDQGGQQVKEFAPRTQAELTQLEELVRNAIGYNADRGDSVVVSSVPFFIPEEPGSAEKWWSRIQDYLKAFGKPAFNVLLIVLFFLFVVRPVMAWLKAEGVRQESQTPQLPEGEHADELPEPSSPAKGSLGREQVLLLAQQNPERTINLIRSWIDER